MKTEPNDLAWGGSIEIKNPDGSISQAVSLGLTKREHFAAMAMQALLSDNANVVKIKNRECDEGEPPGKRLCEIAADFADGLIDALNKTSSKGDM